MLYLVLLKILARRRNYDFRYEIFLIMSICLIKISAVAYRPLNIVLKGGMSGIMKICVSWDIALCSPLEVNLYFGGKSPISSSIRKASNKAT
jgi:hypothetical protein